MVDNRGITLNYAIMVQVAAISGVCDRIVLEHRQGDFDGVDSSTAGLQERHGGSGSPNNFKG
jgi:hypothetical protein